MIKYNNMLFEIIKRINDMKMFKLNDQKRYKLKYNK